MFDNGSQGSGSIDTTTHESELAELRARLTAAEETLEAIRSGAVDALVVDGPAEPQVYTLKSATDPYRLLVERMAQGALTVSRDGIILYCNESFAEMIDRPAVSLFGSRLRDHVAPDSRNALARVLAEKQDFGREIALQTRQGDPVDAYVSSAPLAVEDDELLCLVVTDLSQQELRRLHAAVTDASSDIIYALDEDLVIKTWNRGATLLTGLSGAQAIGRHERDLWPDSHRHEFDELVTAIRETGDSRTIDAVRERDDGTEAMLLYSLTPLTDRNGRITAYAVVAHDITERKEDEQRLRFLTEEIDHRAKNLLSAVQAIATLSARGTRDLDSFLQAFGNRIQALAAAHSLLSDRNWGGTSVGDIVTAALGGFDDDRRIRTDGGRATLKPRAAQDLALSLHELLTNASKYGSLSEPGGQVEIVWRQRDDRLVVEWLEHGGPPVAPPRRQGLGTLLIRNTAGPGGGVDYRFDETGVTCRIEFPPGAQTT